jgi:hypothetical protein
MTDPSQPDPSMEDEDVSVYLEGSLDAEDGSLPLDALIGEGFDPEDAAQAQA